MAQSRRKQRTVISRKRAETGPQEGTDQVRLLLEAQEALRRSEERYRALVENLNDVIFTTDTQGYFTYVSPAIERISDYEPEEMTGQPFGRFVHPNDVAGVAASFARTLAGQLEPAEFRVFDKQGHVHHIRTSSRPYFDGGHLVGCTGILTDITERKRAEEALRESEQRYRTLTESAHDLIAEISLQGRLLYVSPNHKEILGYEPAELVGRNGLELMHPDDAHDARGLSGKDSAQVLFRFRHKNGEWRWFEGTGRAFVASDGARRGLVISRDVTERKWAEERTAVLLQVAQDVSGTLDLSELLDRVQRRVARALRCDAVVTFYSQPNSEVSRIIAHHGIAEDRLPDVEAVELPPDVAFGGRLRLGETIVVNDLAGTTEVVAGLASRFGFAALVAAPLHVHGRRMGALVALRAEAGQPFEPEQVDLCTGVAGQLAIAIEAVELYRAQHEEGQVSAALARMGQELIASLNTAALLERLCAVTAEVLGCESSHTLFWYPEEQVFRRIASCGATPEEEEIARVVRVPRSLMLGLLSRLEHNDVAEVGTIPTYVLATPAQRGAVQLCMALRRGNDLIGIQVANRRGSVQPFTATQRRIAQGVTQIASLALDRSRAIEELERANRLKSEFVATMSHELRTPLNIMMGYSDLLLEGEFGPMTAEQTETLRRIDKSTRTLHELINATLDLSRLEAGQVRLELTEILVPELIHQIDAEIDDLRDKPNVCFAWNVAPQLPRLRTDALKLKVVIKNLIANALKFTERGSVNVGVRAFDGGVEIAVVDTGIGIAPEALPIIFESFRQVEASLTRRYAGVGLGLYIVRRLLELLRGTIAVESEVGRGSTFRAWVPLASDS